MKQTPNYNLPQFTGDDFFDKDILNDAFDKIEKGLSDVQESINLAEGSPLPIVEELVQARDGKINLKTRLDLTDEEILKLKDIAKPEVDIQALIVNDLTTGGIDKVLSAEQGKVLNTSIIAVNNSKMDKKTIVNDLLTGGADNILSAEQGKVLNTSINAIGNSAINKNVIVNDVTTGGAINVLSAEQGKILNDKISLIKPTVNVSSGNNAIVDNFKRSPFIDNIILNPTNASEYNSSSYGTPTITLVNDTVILNGTINLKTTVGSVLSLGQITKWLLPVRPILIPTTAFTSDFTKTVATAYAIWGDRSSSLSYGDLRLESNCLSTENTFVSLNGTYRVPFNDINNEYDFSAKLTKVKEMKELEGKTIPITILMTADTHWSIPENVNNLMSKQVRAFNYLSDKINSNFNLILGDYMGEADASQGIDVMESKWKAYRYMMKDNTLILKGNHDDASYVGEFDATKVISTERMWDWSMDGKSGLNLNPLEPKNFYYFVDDSTSRTRHIMLNSVDIPYSKTTNTYKGFNTFVVRKTQIEWLINEALKVPEGYDVAIYSHHSLYENITPTDVELVNRDVIKKVLIDFMNGTDSTITSTTASTYPELGCTVTTNFSTQGKRKLIGSFFGHHHKDFFLKEEEINHIGMASMRPYNAEIGSPWDRPQTGIESFCAECIQIDVVNKKVYLTRFGYGNDRSFTY